MIRLAVIGASHTSWQAIAPRLRGVTLRTDPDAADCAAVVVEGPPALASSTAERYLREGKQVLVTADGSLTRAMLDCVNLSIANPERYLPSRQLVRQQLDAGKLGEPGLIRLHRWQPPPADRRQSLLRDLDLVLWYFGKTPERVYAVGDIVHLGFPGGGMALLDHACLLPGAEEYCSLSLVGSAGAVYAGDHQNMQLLYRMGPPQAVRTGESMLAMTALVQDFVDSIAAGRESSPQRAVWRSVIDVSDAVQESLSTRQAVLPKGGVP